VGTAPTLGRPTGMPDGGIDAADASGMQGENDGE